MDAWRNMWRTPTLRNTFITSFLAWSFDSFDFFLVIFAAPQIAKEFKNLAADSALLPGATLLIFLSATLTLLTRPLGAFIFGAIADRYGRRLPLAIDVAAFSMIELLTAFSPNLTVFLGLRALFGIAMGGEWGVGAALAMESLPTKDQGRGLFSGILQAGYPLGNLLAAIAALALHGVSWRILFLLGALPTILVLFIRSRHVQESPVWSNQHPVRAPLTVPGVLDAMRDEWALMRSAFRRDGGLFIYAILLMAALTFMSHGSQDAYPLFLNRQVRLDDTQTTIITAIYVVGAICGSILFGYQSDRFGRRRSLIAPAALALLVVPLWTGLFPGGRAAFGQVAFADPKLTAPNLTSPPVVLLVIGAFLMQFMVQGAYGVIPVHLNELSPAGLRGTFPGLTYQLGAAIAALGPLLPPVIAQITAADRSTPNYALGQALVLAPALVAAVIIAARGRDRTGRALETADTEERVAA